MQYILMSSYDGYIDCKIQSLIVSGFDYSQALQYISDGLWSDNKAYDSYWSQKRFLNLILWKIITTQVIKFQGEKKQMLIRRFQVIGYLNFYCEWFWVFESNKMRLFKRRCSDPIEPQLTGLRFDQVILITQCTAYVWLPKGRGSEQKAW